MKKLSLICVDESSTFETVALRGALEYLNYVPTVRWLGSVDQFKDILSGKEPTELLVFLSSHGCDEGFYSTDDVVVSLNDLSIHLQDKIVVSLGCKTGSQAFAQAFIKGGASVYIGPSAYPEGNSTLIFALVFAWKFQLTNNSLTAWEEASKLLKDSDDKMHIYQKTRKGMKVDDNREILLS